MRCISGGGGPSDAFACRMVVMKDLPENYQLKEVQA
jgi:hypothetical protein